MSTDVNELDGIERDLARTRSRLDATLDELQQKLSPGELMSQAVTYIKRAVAWSSATISDVACATTRSRWR